MKISRTLSALILAAAFISNPVSAESGTEGKKLADKLGDASIAVSIEVNSCNADAAKLCPGLPLNSKKSFMCLMAYEDNLSSACIIGLAEAMMAVEMTAIALDYSIQACEEDADKHCIDVKPGEGRIVSCLRKNESKLKKSCINALKETGFWNIGNK
jgi:Cysteine rich repeat